MLKISILILVVINYSQQLPPQNPDEIEKVVGNCITSTGVDPSLPEKAFTKGEFTDDQNFKCFVKCMFVAMGDMSESGQFLPDNMKSRTPPGITQAQANQIVDDCVKPTGTDPCDIAFNAAKCMIDEAVKLVG